MFLYITSIRRKPAMASVLFALSGTFAGNPIFKITFKKQENCGIIPTIGRYFLFLKVYDLQNPFHLRKRVRRFFCGRKERQCLKKEIS